MKTIVFTLVLSLVRTAAAGKVDYYDYGDYDYISTKEQEFPVEYLMVERPPEPWEELADLRDCRPESPCHYGHGDCGEAGDEGCEADLVCGVNNCGDFVGGMTGSCCAQASSSTYSRELNGESAAPWTSWLPTWGGWGRQRGRVLTARDGTRSYQTEKQILD